MCSLSKDCYNTAACLQFSFLEELLHALRRMNILAHAYLRDYDMSYSLADQLFGKHENAHADCLWLLGWQRIKIVPTHVQNDDVSGFRLYPPPNCAGTKVEQSSPWSTNTTDNAVMAVHREAIRSTGACCPDESIQPCYMAIAQNEYFHRRQSMMLIPFVS